MLALATFSRSLSLPLSPSLSLSLFFSFSSLPVCPLPPSRWPQILSAFSPFLACFSLPCSLARGCSCVFFSFSLAFFRLMLRCSAVLVADGSPLLSLFRIGPFVWVGCGSPLFVGVLPGSRLPPFRCFSHCLPQRLVFSPLCSLALFVFPSLSLALFFLFSCLYSRWLPERRALAFAATWVNRVGASHFEDNCFKLGRMASRPLRGGFFVVRFAPFLASRRLPPVAAPVFCFVSDGFRPPLLGLRVFLWCMDFSRRSIPISCFFCLFSISRDFLTLPLAPCC